MQIKHRDFFLIFVLIVVIAVISIYQFTRPPQLYGVIIDSPKPVLDFTLQSANGPVSLSEFRNKIVILYFGYTACPDVCPLTLAKLRQAMDSLGDKAKDVQVIFISVDWKRDTPEKVASYTEHFRSDFLGLAGTQAQIDAVTKDYGIFYLLNPPDNNGYYSVDHTATVQVLNRQRYLVLTWLMGQTTDKILSDLRVLLATK